MYESRSDIYSSFVQNTQSQPDMTKIAIVEDNPDIRLSITRWINAAPDHQCVCTCPNAEAALIEIPRCRPDVVLMDIQLPGESGIVCTARLKDLLPDLLVIVLTVYRDRDLLFQALQAGASGYLLKRSTPAEVLNAIAEVRSGGAPMTREIARMVVETFRRPTLVKDPATELSEREMEILTLVSKGFGNKEIGMKLDISFFTARAHLRRIYKKLHVRCRAEAVAKLLRRNP
jgi:DNA-binding NarL/FixJ family response regulator